jgi:hypothetical protein
LAPDESTPHAKHAATADRDPDLRSNMVTFPAQPHALPFRTLLGEYRARAPHRLAVAIEAARQETDQYPPHPATAYDPSDNKSKSEWTAWDNKLWKSLQPKISASEQAYRELADEKEKLEGLRQNFLKTQQQLKSELVKLKKQADSLKTAPSKPTASGADVETNVSALQAELKIPLERKIAEGYRAVLAKEGECKEADRPLLAVLHGVRGSAVCFSGGGIRSASFCLGILQALARFSQKNEPVAGRKSLLESLDYLSTVSGGGYIGSWLMAWASRAGYARVIQLLSGPADTSADPEPQPIRHLREYTSYLAPQYGLSLDTLTLLAIVMRNLVLNWMILVPAVIVLLCLPELLYEASVAVPLYLRSSQLATGALVFAAALVAWAAVFAAKSIINPAYASKTKNPQTVGSSFQEVAQMVFPLMLAAWILAENWAWSIHNSSLTADSPLFDIVRKFAFFSIVPATVLAVVRLYRFWPSFDKKVRSPLRKQDLPNTPPPGDVRGKTWAWLKIVDWWSVAGAIIAPLLTGLIGAIMLAACAKYIPSPTITPLQPKDWTLRQFVWLCVPVIWCVLMLALTFLSGLLSSIEQEEEREWWARAGGLLIFFQLAWIALVGIALYGADIGSALVVGILTAVGLGSGYLGSLAGLSAATTSGLKRVNTDQLTKTQQFLSRHNLFAPVACTIAIATLSLALAVLTSHARIGVYNQLINTPACAPSDRNVLPAANNPLRAVTAAKPACAETGLSQAVRAALKFTPIDSAFLDKSPDDADAIFGRRVAANVIVLIAALVIALLANFFVNVNIFSLHGMYRMRLSRAYLGASNFARHPDNFTNFDEHDNLYEADVVHHDSPLHVINTALNLVATTNLAWQQRKAESFTFSPFSVGSWRLGYLPTQAYGGSRGVRLGTAMAISGAAFNPNMGYHSSPLVTLLMTFFNARLGWWLPNPIWPVLQEQAKTTDQTDAASPDRPPNLETLLKRPAVANYLRRSGPAFALGPLINEALGRTDDTYKWIELSDGGHFENLGLYEMVLRRCRYIIVVDAGADSKFEFEDLGNAVRKIEIDLGVPIRFPKYPSGLPMKSGILDTNVYYAVGVILYGCVDDCAGVEPGKLLYIKPALKGSEPPGIRAYANAHCQFPHESTINQFFNEAQFESYRNLGSWELANIIGEFTPDATTPKGNDIDAFFARIKEPDPTPQESDHDLGAAWYEVLAGYR